MTIQLCLGISVFASSVNYKVSYVGMIMLLFVENIQA
jgi:hypothetical protein